MENIREKYKQELKQIIENKKIWVVGRKVSKSGLSAVLSFFVIHEDRLRNVDWLIAKVLEYKLEDEGIRIQGVGLDREGIVVEQLERVLGIKLNYEWI